MQVPAYCCLDDCMRASCLGLEGHLSRAVHRDARGRAQRFSVVSDVDSHPEDRIPCDNGSGRDGVWDALDDEPRASWLLILHPPDREFGQ